MENGGEVLAVVSPGSMGGNYVKRKALSTMFSVAVVTCVMWVVLLAQVPDGPGGYTSALFLLAESLTISLFGALMCPGAALAANGMKGTGDTSQLAIAGAALGSMWLLVWLSAVNPALYYPVLLVAPVILYIGIRRAVARLSNRAFNRNILIIGDEQPIEAIHGQVARQAGGRRQIRTRVLIRRADDTLSDAIVRLVADERVNEIVVAFRDRRGDRIAMSTLLDLKMRGVKIWDSTKFIEHEKGRVELDGLRPGWIVYSDGFSKSLSFRMLKRSVDIVFSAVGLTLCVPIMLLTALVVRLYDSGPAIYRQNRVGFAGKPFVLYKFRSMATNAEETSQPMWAQENDPRVTSVGRFIRAARIDELPQLINVLKGEMSLVGPRPERPEFVAVLKEQIEYYGLRFYIQPGITGWAQINVGYTDDCIGAMQKLSYDLYYMKHASLWLDMYIFARTLRTILWGEGAR